MNNVGESWTQLRHPMQEAWSALNPEHLAQVLFEGIKGAIATFFGQWIEVHPFLRWLLSHPLWLLGTVLVVVLGFGSFVLFVLNLPVWSILKKLNYQLWSFVFTLPIKLAKLILQALISLGRQFRKEQTMTQNVENASAQDQLERIFVRLDQLKAEQDELLSEVQLLVKSQLPSSPPALPNPPTQPALLKPARD